MDAYTKVKGKTINSLELTKERKIKDDFDKISNTNRDEKLWKCIPRSHWYLVGIFYALMHAFFKATSTTMAKLSSSPAPMLALYSSLITLIGNSLIIVYLKESVLGTKKSDVIWLILRGVGGSSAFLTIFYSVKFIPVTEATVIKLSSPIFGITFAWVFLSEPFGVYEAVMLLLTIFGVICVVNPLQIVDNIGDEVTITDHIIGCLLSLACAVSFAMVGIVLRKLKHVHATASMFWLGLMFTITSFAVVMISGE